MNLNLLQHTQATFGVEVIQLASSHFGIEVNKAKAIVDTLVPTLIGWMAKRADTVDGAHALYSSVMWSKVDASIVTNLPLVFANPTSVSNLLKIGTEQTAHLLGDKTGNVIQAVALHTDTAVNVVAPMAALTTATLLGLVKNYLQTGKSQQHLFISTLAHQIPFIQGRLPEDVWAALGVGSTAAFFNSIESRLNNTLAALHVATPHVVQTVQPSAKSGSTPNKKGSLEKWWWVLLLLALIGLLFFLRGCNKSPTSAIEPVAQTVVASASVAPGLTLVTDKDGKANVSATVGSEEEKSAILEDLKKNYGDGVEAHIVVASTAQPADWLGKLPDLLGGLKMPNVELAIKNNNIELGGGATDPKLGLLDKTRTLFGSAYKVSMFDLSEALADHKQQFETALSNLKPGVCTTPDVVAVMNIYSFNFPSGSFEIPKEDALEFAKAVTAIKDCAKGAKMEIGGHTDNVGSSAVNMELSQKRADAVRDFFVSKGIALATFTTKAYGDSKPIGDNDIASGRFQNRRIEFNETK
ncbi:OmpA family protein [Collimonas sp. NPDC087041]|uniref:OmpA family protein n=1 Tax=Collimonas sp. NPDC087041 TaxID=3363960 RepID=UPI0037F4D5BD